MKRYFVAIELPDKLKESARALQESFPFQFKWSSCSTMHLTLTFIGDLIPREVEVGQEALSHINQPSFVLNTGRIGYFARKGVASVLWLGLATSPELLELKRAVDYQLDSQGIDHDRKRFFPHITLGRSKENRAHQVEQALESISLPEQQWCVEEFTLFQSVLMSQGAQHSVVQSFSLDKKDGCYG